MANDPFAKDDKGAAASKQEFDFGDPANAPKGGGNRTRFIIAAFLVIGALVAAGAYFLLQEDTVNTADEMHPPTPTKKFVKNKTDLASKAPADLPPPPSVETAPKLETPAMPARQETAAAPTPASTPATAPTINKGPELVVKATPPAPVTELPKKTISQEASAEPEQETEEVPALTETIPVLVSPENGASRPYNESEGMARFKWSGKGKNWIAFSRHSDMKPTEFKEHTKRNHYDLPRALPGVWYWQVGNTAGKSEIRTFTVQAPTKRDIAVLEPKDGSSLAKEGGMITWRGDHMITYYRVEFSTQGWANPNYRFATTGTQFQVRNLPQGQYQMRLGAFSEVSGRWEYTDPIKVAVQ